jgi:hypothetical protein
MNPHARQVSQTDGWNGWVDIKKLWRILTVESHHRNYKAASKRRQ